MNCMKKKKKRLAVHMRLGWRPNFAHPLVRQKLGELVSEGSVFFSS